MLDRCYYYNYTLYILLYIKLPQLSQSRESSCFFLVFSNKIVVSPSTEVKIDFMYFISFSGSRLGVHSDCFYRIACDKF